MAKASPTAASVEHDRLSECVDELREEVRVLRDVVDELRSEMQWLANNREAVGESPNGCFIVRQMAADPCAKDWVERLVIERGEPASVVVEVLEDVMPPAEDAPAVKPSDDGRKQPRLF